MLGIRCCHVQRRRGDPCFLDPLFREKRFDRSHGRCCSRGISTCELKFIHFESNISLETLQLEILSSNKYKQRMINNYCPFNWMRYKRIWYYENVIDDPNVFGSWVSRFEWKSNDFERCIFFRCCTPVSWYKPYICHRYARRYAGRLKHRKYSIDVTQTRHDKIRRKVRKKGIGTTGKTRWCTRWRVTVVPLVQTRHTN
jgi:hypothetical protein